MLKRWPFIGSVVTALTAVAGASCCLIPVMLFNMGVGGAFLAHIAESIAVLKPYRIYFIGVSTIFLFVGLYQYQRNFKALRACDGKASCSNKVNIPMIALALLSLGAAIIWPFVELPLFRAIR